MLSAELTASYLRSIAEDYAFASGVFNTILGLIGNTILILVFSQMKLFRRNQCSFYLTAESCSNIGLILFVCPSYFVRHFTGDDPPQSSLVWCRIRSMFIQLFGICSMYILCCTTFDQFLSTHYNYSIRRMSTLRFAHTLVIFVFIIWSLHSIIFLLVSDIDRLSLGCSVYDPRFRKYLSWFYYPFACNTIPILITVFFSLFAYRNVRRITRRQIPIVRRRLDQQLTAIVLARVLCGIVLGVPYIVAQIYQLNMQTSTNDQIETAVAVLVRNIMNSLIYANFSVSFN